MKHLITGLNRFFRGPSLEELAKRRRDALEEALAARRAKDTRRQAAADRRAKDATYALLRAGQAKPRIHAAMQGN